MNKEQLEAILRYWQVMDLLDQSSFSKTEYQTKNRQDDVFHPWYRRHAIAGVDAQELMDFLPVKKEMEAVENYLCAKREEKQEDIEKPDIECSPIRLSVGLVSRQKVMQSIMRHFSRLTHQNYYEQSVEQTDDQIVLFTFDIMPSGCLIKESIRVSPLLWANRELAMTRELGSEDLLTREKYEQTLMKINAWALISESIPEEPLPIRISHIRKLKQGIETGLVWPFGSEDWISAEYKIEERTDEETPVYLEGLELGTSFYSDDMRLIQNMVRHKKPLPRVLHQFILALCPNMQRPDDSRIDLLPHGSGPDQRKKSYDFYSRLMNIHQAAPASWPSSRHPVFMQQAALNLVMGNAGSYQPPVVSVNGPPGTGKTTMIKDVLASSILGFARQLARQTQNLSSVDELFESFDFVEPDKKSCSRWHRLKDPSLARYSILMASNNNGAVENITAKVPILENFLGEFEPGSLRQQFWTELQSLDSVYLTAQASKMFAIKDNSGHYRDQDCIGLVCAPLGRRGNLKRFFFSTIRQIMYFNGFSLSPSSALVEAMIQEDGSFCFEMDQITERLEQLHKDLLPPLPEEDGAMDLEPVMSWQEKRQLAQHRFEQTRKLFIELDRQIEAMKKPLDGGLDYSLFEDLMDSDPEKSCQAHLKNPDVLSWLDEKQDLLFALALKMREEFIWASRRISENLRTLAEMWQMSFVNGHIADFKAEKKGPLTSALYQTMFLVLPMASTTFASAGTFLKRVLPSTIGLLVVDEAGQAMPSHALGCLLRCQRALIVGDPQQIEPVEPAEMGVLKALFPEPSLAPYKNSGHSVQSFADRISPYGTWLGRRGQDRLWVGCPLVIHRRCEDPMFTISNELSYDSIMRQALPENAKQSRLPGSCWIDIKGTEQGAKNHHVIVQSDWVIHNLLEGRRDPDLFVISPFKTVVQGFRQRLRYWQREGTNLDLSPTWVESHSGTVHTFQGKEASQVVFLLGCDGRSPYAMRWVSMNIINVAVTRARHRLYVVGDQRLWLMHNENMEIVQKHLPLKDPYGLNLTLF